jgi:hypothetical protein
VNRFVGVLAVVGVVLMASAASAQNVSFGYQYQHLSGGDQSINMPAGFNVDGGVPVGSGVSLVGQFDWSRKSESEVVFGTSVNGTINVSTFGGGVRWSAPMPNLEPFVDVLFGGTHFSANGNVAGVQVASGSETDPMLQIGGGVAVPLRGILSVLGQFDYRRVFTDDEGTNSIRFVAGIRVGFGH